MKNKNKKGFTLIELLVVISVIGLLASVIMVSLNSARAKARLTKRVADLRQIHTALELYYNDNGRYPTSSSPNYRSECAGVAWGWSQVPADQVIPGLVPQYMSKFPTDPGMDLAGNNGNGRSCYAYVSDAAGKDYKFIDHDVAEFSAADYLSHPELVDPLRDGGGQLDCIINGSNPWSWAIASPGWCAWRW